jgi:hypothetical protein
VQAKFGVLATLGVVLMVVSGCSDNANTASNTSVATGGDNHSECRHGPNGGDLFDIEGHEMVGELGYNKSNDVITIFLLQKDEETPRPIQAESIVVNYTGGKEPESYALTAVERDAKGMAAEFALDSKPLSMIVFMPCEIVMKDGDSEIKVNLPKRHRHNH